MRASVISSLLLVFFWTSSTHGARILFLAGFATKSHKNAFIPVIQELGKRNHTVISVTPYKSKKPSKGVVEIIVEGIESLIHSSIPEGEDMLEHDSSAGAGMVEIMKIQKKLFLGGCEITLSQPYIQDLVAGKEPRPDLIILSSLYNDCYMGVVQRLKVSFVLFSPGFHMPWMISGLRVPHDPTYCPQPHGDITDRMAFFDRLKNAMMVHVFSLLHTYYWGPEGNAVMKNYLGEDLPSFQEIEKNASLIIVNSHFSTDYPRPATPNIVEAGGMHINEPKPLTKNLEDWVSGSGEHGVVYFSLGSAFPGSKMPEKYCLMFVKAFASIPQRVLWKWEIDEMSGLPPNVRISKWLPQQDLLAHSKLKVFITHGGLLSTMEATHFGVAVIGLPLFADQKMNMKNTEASGAGIMLDWNTLSAEKLVDAITSLIEDEKYKIKVSQRSMVSQDRDIHPLDKAIYWIEYVIRHDGAYHLQPASLYLNDVQYYMLDIYLFFHGLLAALVAVVYLLCRRCCYRN